MPKISLLTREIKDENYNNLLTPKTLKSFEEMSSEHICNLIKNVISMPMKFEHDFSGEIYKIYFIFCWQQLFKNINLNHKSRVLEVASGQSDPVPQALEKYTQGLGQYVTANLNKKLTAGLLRKTANLNISVDVIEDNAINLEKYYQNEIFDVACFQHAINDMIQTIIACKEGIDTVNNDWFEILPEMIAAVNKYYIKEKLKEVVFDKLIEQIRVCSSLLKSDGFLVFNNHIFQMDLDAGYNSELYKSFIPLIRKWIKESDLDLKEITYEHFAPQWWLFLQK